MSLLQSKDATHEAHTQIIYPSPSASAPTTLAFLLLNTASMLPSRGLCICYCLHLKSFLLITSFEYLIWVVFLVPPAPYNVMSSSSFSLHRSFKISKQNSNIFLACYCLLVCSCIGEWQAWPMHPVLKPGHSTILTLFYFTLSILFSNSSSTPLLNHSPISAPSQFSHICLSPPSLALF